MEAGLARRAVTELIAGIEGSAAREVLSGCSSCLSCNTYCPTGADPYFLILERWGDLYARRGAPAIYRFVCPNQPDNIWNRLEALASEEERALFWRWHENTKKPEGRPLILGNYAHLFPHIVDTPVFDGFTIIDPIGHWECGAYLTQAGYLSEVGKIARIVKDYFDELGDREVVVLTDAVRLLLTRFIPERFGIEFTPRFLSFTEWLAQSIRQEKIPRRERVKLALAVHDNCYAKAAGAPLYDAAREVLSWTGARVVELSHNRDESYCCGFGRGAADISKHTIPFAIMKGAARKIREAEEACAEGLVTYCTGCMYLLWAARELLGSRVAVYHLVEPVTMAMGAYKYADLVRQRERAWDIIALITVSYVKSLFQGRLFIGDPADTRYPPVRDGAAFLRLFRSLFLVPPIRWIYAAGFRGLMRLP